MARSNGRRRIAPAHAPGESRRLGTEIPLSEPASREGVQDRHVLTGRLAGAGTRLKSVDAQIAQLNETTFSKGRKAGIQALIRGLKQERARLLRQIKQFEQLLGM